LDRFEARKQRLIRLKDEFFHGRISTLALRIGKCPSYVARLLYPADNPQRKNIGDKLVSDIEKALNLPRGWLDGLTEADNSQVSITDEQVNFLRLFEAMPPSEKKAIIEMMTEKKREYDRILDELLKARESANRL
jgi:HTH-type transcriptional regulator, cell division transcriptional repressor